MKNLYIKRILDILLGMVGFVLFLFLYIILFPVIGKDGGKIIYSQVRIGKNLKPFKIYKFRTMHINAEEKLEKLLRNNVEIREEYYKNFKLKEDPRITKVGFFLRKTSLDEFPQFINVLKGDMSIVGPRPVTDEEIAVYYKDKAKEVFSMRPGITGMWQANGRSDIEDYSDRIRLDLLYLEKFSIYFDFILIIKTLKNVIFRKGAY